MQLKSKFTYTSHVSERMTYDCMIPCFCPSLLPEVFDCQSITTNNLDPKLLNIAHLLLSRAKGLENDSQILLDFEVFFERVYEERQSPSHKGISELVPTYRVFQFGPVNFVNSFVKQRRHAIPGLSSLTLHKLDQYYSIVATSKKDDDGVNHLEAGEVVQACRGIFMSNMYSSPSSKSVLQVAKSVDQISGISRSSSSRHAGVRIESSCPIGAMPDKHKTTLVVSELSNEEHKLVSEDTYHPFSKLKQADQLIKRFKETKVPSQ